MTFGGANTYIDLAADGKIIGIFGSYANPEINILRLTSSGTLDNDFGTSGKTTINATNTNEYPTAIKVQPNGKILVTGSIGSSADLFIARINKDGTLDNTFGTNGSTLTSVREGGEDNALTLLVQSDGKIVVAGNQCGGMCTYILLRYNANAVENPTSVLAPNKNFTANIYPNPANENLYITMPETNTIISTNILNVNGQKIKESKDNLVIPIHDLPNGLYFIQITSNHGSITQKFIKE
jgi:uncharacterized delta-60 repeat protein